MSYKNQVVEILQRLEDTTKLKVFNEIYDAFLIAYTNTDFPGDYSNPSAVLVRDTLYKVQRELVRGGYLDADTLERSGQN